MNGRSIYDVHNFQEEVLQRSFQIPVVVDFWAEWCGPCKMLGPLLEKLAQQQSDRWALAKVDTEQFTDEAIRYGIQSIPNVKMFSEGNVIGEFVGALPEHSILQWLKKTLPNKNKLQIETAKLLLAEGRESDAQKVLEEIIQNDPEDIESRMLLARLTLFTNPHTSAELSKNIEDPKFSEEQETIQTFLHLFEIHRHPEKLNSESSKKEYLTAISFLLQKEFSSALKTFIEIIRNDRYFDDDGSRRACIAIFKYLGEEHPITMEYRRDFSNALY